MRIQHLINGAAAPSADYFETVNPATQEPLAEVARGGEREVDAAVSAAKAAFPAWAGRPAGERAALLRKLGDLIAKHVADIAAIETRDTGQVIAQTANNWCRAQPTISTTSPRCACAWTATLTRRRCISITRCSIRWVYVH